MFRRGFSFVKCRTQCWNYFQDEVRMVKMPGLVQKIRTLLHLPVLHLNITAVLARIFLVLLFSTHTERYK